MLINLPRYVNARVH